MVMKEERSSSGGPALVRHTPVVHKVVTTLRTAVDGTAAQGRHETDDRHEERSHERDAAHHAKDHDDDAQCQQPDLLLLLRAGPTGRMSIS